MGLMKAAALAPDAILLPANFEAYKRCSSLFKAAVAEIAPTIEDRGINEIFINLTDVPGETVALAQRLKDAVRRATGLSCSIGVTPNKLLSKIASELHKPDGLTVLGLEDLPGRIWPLPPSAINGIGPKASARLEAMGLCSIGQLAAADPAALVAAFGQSYGAWLWEAAHGRDERPLVTRREPKSISRETTFPGICTPGATGTPSPASCWICAPGSGPISSARGGWPGPSASSCAMTISAPSPGTSRWSGPPPARRPSAARRAPACDGCRWNARCACWGSGPGPWNSPGHPSRIPSAPALRGWPACCCRSSPERPWPIDP